jgi:internalin A
MKIRPIAASLLFPLALACDEPKSDAPAPSAAPPATATPSQAPAPVASAPAAPTWTKKLASDCKPHPAVADFGDDAALEHEVRRKLGKETGAITPADLAQVKSINLASVVGHELHQIDPCIFPMFTSLKDLFLGAGDYDDLSPIQKLTTLESLRASLSEVKDLHAIEGLKRLDRLDLSHTLVTDENLKSVGSLVNVTELMLDEDAVSDLTPIANLKKLERLSIKKTQIKDLAPLSGLKSLKFLYIADTPVNDITPVQPLIGRGMKLVQN